VVGRREGAIDQRHAHRDSVAETRNNARRRINSGLLGGPTAQYGNWIPVIVISILSEAIEAY